MACFLSKTACLLLALCAAVAHVPGASAVGMKKKTLTLYQDPPRIVNGTYDSYTFYTYEAVLRSAEGGSAVGFLYGTSTFNSALNVNQPLEVRERRLVFDFGTHGQVTSNGVVTYPANSPFLDLAPVTMAVTGGTGTDWFGATGQVTTERVNAAGAHTHTFQVMYFKRTGFRAAKSAK